MTGRGARRGRRHRAVAPRTAAPVLARAAATGGALAWARGAEADCVVADFAAAGAARRVRDRFDGTGVTSTVARFATAGFATAGFATAGFATAGFATAGFNAVGALTCDVVSTARSLADLDAGVRRAGAATAAGAAVGATARAAGRLVSFRTRSGRAGAANATTA
jgi:hypothetical protein